MKNLYLLFFKRKHDPRLDVLMLRGCPSRGNYAVFKIIYLLFSSSSVL